MLSLLVLMQCNVELLTYADVAKPLPGLESWLMPNEDWEKPDHNFQKWKKVCLFNQTLLEDNKKRNPELRISAIMGKREALLSF